ncbi:MAG TPA: 6-carboxytetrahydropterin synthase [Melioribacteraceae bacterium]|nr:6-carboxytetrahydropterin synthase [Melioribacteraceae bacterium]
MKVSKEYKWEMGHKLMFHEGKCNNLHGHSYKARIELSGNLDKNGMVLDFFIIDSMMNKILDVLDHSFLVYKGDTNLLNLLNQLNFKHLVFDTECTSENIVLYLLKQVKDFGLPKNIKSVKIAVYETEDAYAEDEIEL